MILLLMFEFFTNRASAQSVRDTLHDSRTSQFGVVFLVHYNNHSSSFSRLPGVPSCCREFSTGNGYGFSVGVAYSRPVLDRFDIAARLILSDLSASLSSDEYSTGSWNGKTVPVIIEHTVEASLQIIGIEPQVHFRIFDIVGISAGANLSYLLKGKYSQKEFLEQPSSLLFETGSRYRNTYSGEIPESNSFHAAAIVGITMNLPLDPVRNFTIHPEISFSYSFTDILPANKWRAHAFRFGLSLRKAI